MMDSAKLMVICTVISSEVLERRSHIGKSYSWVQPLGSPTNRISLFQI